MDIEKGSINLTCILTCLGGSLTIFIIGLLIIFAFKTCHPDAGKMKESTKCTHPSSSKKRKSAVASSTTSSRCCSCKGHVSNKNKNSHRARNKHENPTSKFKFESENSHEKSVYDSPKLARCPEKLQTKISDEGSKMQVNEVLNRINLQDLSGYVTMKGVPSNLPPGKSTHNLDKDFDPLIPPSKEGQEEGIKEGLGSSSPKFTASRSLRIGQKTLPEIPEENPPESDDELLYVDGVSIFSAQ